MFAGALKLKEPLEKNVYLPDNKYIKREREVRDPQGNSIHGIYVYAGMGRSV